MPETLLDSSVRARATANGLSGRTAVRRDRLSATARKRHEGVRPLASPKTALHYDLFKALESMDDIGCTYG